MLIRIWREKKANEKKTKKLNPEQMHFYNFWGSLFDIILANQRKNNQWEGKSVFIFLLFSYFKVKLKPNENIAENIESEILRLSDNFGF